MNILDGNQLKNRKAISAPLKENAMIE